MRVREGIRGGVLNSSENISGDPVVSNRRVAVEFLTRGRGGRQKEGLPMKPFCLSSGATYLKHAGVRENECRL